MRISLNLNSKVPIYIQIKEEIIKSIARGDLLINESLPSVRFLSDELGINLHTVRKSYTLLKDEGYIKTDERKRAIISNLPIEKEEKNLNNIKNKIELLVAESYLKGIERDEFILLCEEYFDDYEVKRYRSI